MKNKLKLWLKFELSKRDGFCVCIRVYDGQTEKESLIEILIYLEKI